MHLPTCSRRTSMVSTRTSSPHIDRRWGCACSTARHCTMISPTPHSCSSLDSLQPNSNTACKQPAAICSCWTLHQRDCKSNEHGMVTALPALGEAMRTEGTERNGTEGCQEQARKTNGHKSNCLQDRDRKPPWSPCMQTTTQPAWQPASLSLHGLRGAASHGAAQTALREEAQMWLEGTQQQAWQRAAVCNEHVLQRCTIQVHVTQYTVGCMCLACICLRDGSKIQIHVA
jgi:hypothetical protein